MDTVIIIVCILIVILGFFLAIRAVVRQFRGKGCAGCPMAGDCGKCPGNCKSAASGSNKKRPDTR